MNIAVLGTGNVGKALSGALAAAGHVVTMGSRTADNEARWHGRRTTACCWQRLPMPCAQASSSSMQLAAEFPLRY